MSTPPVDTPFERIVPPELAGERLDRTLASLVEGTSRVRLREMIEDGRVHVNGEVVLRPSHPLEAGDALRAVLRERDRSRSGNAASLELEELHSDEDVIVVAKPAGVVTHPSATVRGGTVSEMATERWGTLATAQGDDRPGIVHRLDAETSGVLVLARSEAAGAELVRQFRDREVSKRYLAVVHGDPRFDSDWIEREIARSDHGSDRMAVVADGEGREAITYYETLERFGDFALLACEPRTGRTHQIRVHLSSIGHTVVSDRLYRARRKLELPRDAPAMPRHALHAQRLGFRHPTTGEELTFEAPLPADMQALLDWLRARG